MNDLLAQIGQGQLVGFVLVLARLSPLFLLAPLFSSRLMPLRVRGIVAVALAMGLAPLALAGQTPPTEVLAIAELVVKEILVGMAFAFAVGMLLQALNTAGTLLDTLIGFSFGATVDPVSGNQGSAVLSQVYTMVGLMVFITINGDALVIRGFAETFQLVPLLEMPDLNRMLTGVVGAFAGLFAAALQIAAPVVLALVLTDAAFGMVTRVVPQVNVLSLGMPAKIIVGLLVIGASLPFVASAVSDQLESSVETALRSLGIA